MPDDNAPTGAVPQSHGDRQTWKVRRIARRRRAELGELRFVSSTRAGRWLWAFLGGLWLLLSVPALLVGNGSMADSIGAAVMAAALFGGLMLILIEEKLLVFERGIVIGSFLLGTRPMVLPFHTIDATTLRASLGWGQIHGMPTLLRHHNGFGAAHNRHHCMWATPALTFVGPDPTLVRGTTHDLRRSQRTTPLTPGESTPTSMWAFGTTTPARLEAVVTALVTALHDAGTPDTDTLLDVALPPRKLTGINADALYLRIPAPLRATNLPISPNPHPDNWIKRIFS